MKRKTCRYENREDSFVVLDRKYVRVLQINE